MSLKVNIEKYFKPDVYLDDVVHTSSTAGLLKNDGTVDTTSYATSASVSAITDGQSIDSFSDVETALAGKADTSDLPSVATSSAVGLVKPDGSSITVDANGMLAAVGGSGNTKLKTRYSVTYSSWSSAVNSDGYYTYSLSLNPTIDTSLSPDVLIAGSNNITQPTDTEKTMFGYVERCYLSSSTLTLYAKTKPTSTFYIYVEGVAGSGSGGIVGNVIQPNGAVSGGGLNYSDVEHVVGTWTENGVTKTLYERTLVSTYVQSGTAVRGTLELTGITDISYLKDIGVFTGVKIADTTYKDILTPAIYYSTRYGCVILDSYLISENKDQYLGQRVSCVVRYTKS